jgi:hypothetical protein
MKYMCHLLVDVIFQSLRFFVSLVLKRIEKQELHKVAVFCPIKMNDEFV